MQVTLTRHLDFGGNPSDVAVKPLPPVVLTKIIKRNRTVIFIGIAEAGGGR